MNADSGKQEPQDLLQLVTARYRQSTVIPERFFQSQAGQIAEACWAMARRFHQGGRLLAFGNGAWATDAQHVTVEFVHPVIVGKRALPALSLTNDSATISGLMSHDDTNLSFARLLSVLARPQDMAMGFSRDGNCANVTVALEKARQIGLLTLALVGEDGGQLAQMDLDFCFVVDAQDPLVIQETHETLYHILWELVHVFFEHEGLLQE